MAGVVRRPHLAIVPAYAVRPLVRRPSPRVLGAVAASAAVLALLYLAARETPLFAVRTLEISGASPVVRTEVEKAADRYLGESLVSLDGEELRRRLESLPSVRSLRYDRAFPHTLRIVVAPERPAAVVRSGPGSWLVSARGRVIRVVGRGELGGMPRIWLAGPPGLTAGEILGDRSARLALGVLVQVPEDFPAAVRSAREREGIITLVLAGGTELRLGGRSAIPLKLAVSARVLRSLSGAERSALAYLDVTVPERPVAADKSQLST